MNVLGLDTCFGALSVAVGVGLSGEHPRVVARHATMATGHAERLVPVMNELLAEAGLTFSALDRIAVTIGPGSFTGTRIGIAAARALHLAHGTPIVALTSLEAMALHPAIGDIPVGTDLAIAVDAHRGEAYIQIFDGHTREPVAPPAIVPQSGYAAVDRGRPLVIAGTAAAAVAEALAAHGRPAHALEVEIWPGMERAILRAVARPPSEAAIEPLYLRPPDAKPQDGKSLARAHPVAGSAP